MNDLIDRLMRFSRVYSRSSPGVKHSNEIVSLNFANFSIQQKNVSIFAVNFSKNHSLSREEEEDR